MEQQNNAQESQNMQDMSNMAQNQATQNQVAQNSTNPYYVNGTQQAEQNARPINAQNETPSLFGSFDSSDFLKGALIGAAAGYLLTNEKAQKAIFKTVAKGTQMLQMGVEEMKERFEDAKAEMESH